MDDQTAHNIPKNKFYFNNREIAMLAAFLALLLATNLIWITGHVVGNVIYGIVEGLLMITAAIVIGKKYTVLTLGVARTIAEILIAGAFVGSLTAFTFLINAIVLEAILQSSKPYAGSLKINVAGTAVYGLVTRIVFIGISVVFYGMVLPTWLLAFMIIVPVITFAIGGFLGDRIGNRVKTAISSM